VPGNEADIVSQREEFFADGIEQFPLIAARKIGAADGAPEEHVTDHGQARVGGVENHMPGRMPRCVDDLQCMFTHLDRIAILEPSIRLENLRLAEAEPAALLGQLVDPELVAAMRTLDGQLQPRKTSPSVAAADSASKGARSSAKRSSSRAR